MTESTCLIEIKRETKTLLERGRARAILLNAHSSEKARALYSEDQGRTLGPYYLSSKRRYKWR
jgi:hypothetical protein